MSFRCIYEGKLQNHTLEPKSLHSYPQGYEFVAMHYGGLHQKSWTALVVALNLRSEGDPVAMGPGTVCWGSDKGEGPKLGVFPKLI